MQPLCSGDSLPHSLSDVKEIKGHSVSIDHMHLTCFSQWSDYTCCPPSLLPPSSLLTLPFLFSSPSSSSSPPPLLPPLLLLPLLSLFFLLWALSSPILVLVLHGAVVTYTVVSSRSTPADPNQTQSEASLSPPHPSWYVHQFIRPSGHQALGECSGDQCGF